MLYIVSSYSERSMLYIASSYSERSMLYIVSSYSESRLHIINETLFIQNFTVCFFFENVVYIFDAKYMNYFFQGEAID